MTGLQLAEAIKKEWPELPVIVATGFAEMDRAGRRALPKLAKPFTEHELAKAIDGVITRTRDAARVLKFRTRPGSKN